MATPPILGQTQTTPSGVTFIELEGFGEVLTEDGADTTTRMLGCPWSDRQTFKFDMMGDVVAQPGLGWIRRTLPAFLPESLSYAGVAQPKSYSVVAMELDRGIGAFVMDEISKQIHYATDVDAEGDAFVDGIALYRVTYKRQPYPFLTDAEMLLARNSSGNPILEMSRYLWREAKFNVENLQMPASSLRRVDTGMAYPIELPKIFPTAEMQYHWRLVPAIPTAALSLLGKVNSQTFDVDNEYFRAGFPPGTLLYAAVATKRYLWGPFGRLMFDIDYLYTFRATGWNSILLKSGASSAFIELTTTGQTVPYPAPPGAHIYDDGDFNNLFLTP